MEDLVYYITLLSTPIAVYFLFFKQKHNRFFTNRDLLYFVKLVLATSAVKQHQKRCEAALDDESKSKLENPKKIQSDFFSDNHFIYGVDQKGNSLSLRFTVRPNLVAEVFLCLRLKTITYTFPGENLSKLYRLSDWQWKTKDLHIEVLEPFKRLRVSYNGLLSNASRNVEHVQFNFIWTAASAPQFHPQQTSTHILADALARQKWKDGNWISLLGDGKGYEQFGSMLGHVRGDAFANDLVLSLPSCRTRSWGTDEKLVLDSYVHLFVAGHDGTIINLWIKSSKKDTEIQNGSVLMSNKNISPITNTDVRLERLAQNRNLPSAFLAHIQIREKTFRIAFHMKTKSTVRSSSVHLEFNPPTLLNTPGDCDLNTHQARSLVEFWYNGQNNILSLPPPPLLIENKITSLPDSFSNCYATGFEEENARIVRLTGGKGASLAMLTSIKSDDFVVPNGFVVTVSAFNKQLEENFNLKKSVAILEDICYKRSKGDLQQACAETVKTFQKEKILPEITEAIITALTNTKRDPEVAFEAWAVRSSATGEDSEDLSAAGQNETFLGCGTTADVVRSVASCWASNFGYQSVAYRHRHGLPVASQMAVVVQRMVPSDFAGVLFTCHPSTGNPAHMVITANHGLGESVVSGRSEPDTVILERTFDNDVTIKSKTLGSKTRMIKMVEGGVEETDGLEDFSIADNQALQLGRVGVLLEEKFGSARDIEWGFYQGRLFLLQARPVTTLNSWSSFELLHEFDSSTTTENVVLTTANTGEILPGAISALTMSTVVWGIDAGICDCMGEWNPYVLMALQSFQHHFFIDVIGGLHRQMEEDIDLAHKILDLAIIGHVVVDERIHDLSLSRFGVTPRRTRMKEMCKSIKAAWKNEEFAQRAKELAQSDIDLDEQRDSLKDVYLKLTKSVEMFRRLAIIHSNTTKTSVMYQIFAMVVLAEDNKDFNMDHYNDVAMILASCDDVVSAEIPNTLANLTKILVCNDLADEFKRIEPGDGRKWLQERSPEASQVFEKFLQDHGHRGMREFDLYMKSWSSNPSDLIKIIQTNCKITGSRRDKQRRSIDSVISGLVSPKKASTKRILKFLIKKCRKAVGIREQTKSEIIRFVNKMRIAYTFLGEKMASSGLIPDSGLIFHLTHFEIGQIVDGFERSSVLILKALKRQKLYAKWDELKFPEISYQIPQTESRSPIPRTGSSRVRCEGTPVCTGVVQARAAVITDLKNINQLQEGDILITYCTDIGWSPYFPILGGIVTELGGLVSHGAVIAREYGLPCIVGAKDATKIFKTGDIVMLSGQQGTIELV